MLQLYFTINTVLYVYALFILLNIRIVIQRYFNYSYHFIGLTFTKECISMLSVNKQINKLLHCLLFPLTKLNILIYMLFTMVLTSITTS
jgi:hypothetical protein